MRNISLVEFDEIANYWTQVELRYDVDFTLNSEWLCENYSDLIYYTAFPRRKKLLLNPKWIPAAGREWGTRMAREWRVRIRLLLGSSVTPGVRRTRILTLIILVSIRAANISNYQEALPPRQILPPTIHLPSSIIYSCKIPSRHLWTSNSIFILLEDRADFGEPFLMTNQVSACSELLQYRSLS